MRLLLLGLLMATGACGASTTAPTAGTADVEAEDASDDTTIEEDAGETEDTGTAADTRRDTATADTRPPACIKAGASGCTSYGDCCEAECQSARCCKTRLQTGFVCSANAECCDGFCTGSKCCVPPGQKCTLNSMCCSNWCGRRLKDAPDGGVTSELSVCCNPAGKTCAGNDDCCSRSCSGGTCVCLATGAPCAQYADSVCCSGTCGYTSGVGYRCK
jgi:hypothetical protein